MDFLEEVIFYILSNDLSIKNIVSTRIYPLKAPDNPTFPFITFNRIAVVPDWTLEPTVKPNLTNVYLQIDIWAKKSDTFATLKDLSLKVKNALNLTIGTYDNVDIKCIFFNQERNEWDSEIEVFRAMQEYKCVLLE